MGKQLDLKYGLAFAELYAREGLIKLDRNFCAWLQEGSVELFNKLMQARQSYPSRGDESKLLTALAPYIEDFIGELFDIEKEIADLRGRHQALANIFHCKRQFVQRFAAKKYGAEEAALFNGNALRNELEKLFGEKLTQDSYVKHVYQWGREPEKLDVAARYAAWAAHTVEGRHYHKADILFRLPKKIDFQHLIPVVTEEWQGVTRYKLPDSYLRVRHGFGLTDAGGDLTYALDQAHYCIFCHEQDKDSCRKGLPDKTIPGAYKKSEGGIELAGCPLDEKISEMNFTKAEGNSIGALAIAIVDNPMVAATGHRICNDCMKSCIYQKQDPVDIPQIETRTLRDVLALPWGFEIYSLLTRWNPLNFARPLPKPTTHKNVLVVGAGPAGFTLAHHLLNDGHHVAMIDGLKIEPLNIPFAPIYNAQELEEDLDSRINAGFGGVAEYGITVRWDKNFLKIIRLLLERREALRIYGGVRFGGTLNIEQAFKLGFDHIALCMGAGKPKIPAIKNNLAKGVRTASDFLMALQLTGAGKMDSLANLQVRLPIVVIGGGLTAVDTATEALAYYPRQVEKFLQRYEKLGAISWNAEEKQIADEFIAHAKALRAEPHRKLELLKEWGGATIVYRRQMIQSPSYTLNHEELHKALEEGITFAENLTPHEITVDDFGAAESLLCNQGAVKIPAKTILMAAGTQPNIMLAEEDDIVFNPKNSFMLQDQISYFGDQNPEYAGNVVKAMASAKDGYPFITRALEKLPANQNIFAKLDAGLKTKVVRVERLTPTIVEVVVHAPFAAANFHPGQFYRLQNFGTPAMEPLAMTGAWVDKEKGHIAVIALEMGGSSDLCAQLKPDEPVILMGPTGTPSEIPENEKIILVGGGLGNAVLFSIGQAMRAKGNQVIYFAGYKKLQDRFKVEHIESAADIVVWCSDEAPGFKPSRPQDQSFVGNVVEAMKAHPDLVKGADRIIAIGSDRMMAAVAAARVPAPIKIGSINSPMQCMMKEICGQCLQRQVDPATGLESIVFSCVNQDQPLEAVDFKCLSDRLAQNNAQEKITAAYLKEIL